MRERRRSGEIVLQRRRTPRASLRIEVTCVFGGVPLFAITTKLSAAGCFVETETPVPEHAAVDLTLHLSDGPEPAKASGRVVQVQRRQDDTLGFAVEFDGLDDVTRARITNLVERATTSAGSTKTTETEVAPCARCGHAQHHGPKGGPLACTNVRCDCDEYVSSECPGYLGKAKAGECPGVFGEHLDGCPDVTP